LSGPEAPEGTPGVDVQLPDVPVRDQPEVPGSTGIPTTTTTTTTAPSTPTTTRPQREPGDT
jgi:hypothetical protein